MRVNITPSIRRYAQSAEHVLTFVRLEQSASKVCKKSAFLNKKCVILRDYDG